MLNAKAAVIIKTFSGKERQEFADFLKSPYFNSNKNLVKLYGFIQKYFHRMDNEQVTEEFLYTKLFPGKNFNYGIMKNLMSSLAKLSEKFLIVNKQNTENENIIYEIHLMNEFGNRGLDAFFRKIYDKTETRLDSSMIYEEYYNDYRSVFEVTRNYYRNKSDLKNYSRFILRGTEFIFPFIVTLLSNEVVLQFAAEHGTNDKPETDILREFVSRIRIDDFIKFVENNNIRNKTDIIIKLKILNLFANSGESDEVYYELRNDVFENHLLYSNSMLYVIYNNILNYAEKRASEGKTGFIAERYNVLKKMFSHVKMNSDGVGFIFLSNYFDVVMTGIKLGDLDYAAEFAEKFRKDLEPAVRESAYLLARAYLYAAEEKYDSCIEILARTDQTDHLVKLRTKFLYLKCYYELKMFEQGISMVDSFNKYIADTKELHPDFRKRLRDTCKSYLALFKISASPERYNAEKIERQIKFVKSSKISSKDWYLSKLEELKSSVIA